MKVLTIFKSNTHKEKTALSKFVASELIRSSNKDFNNLHTNKVVEILKKEMPVLFSRIRWDGMYNDTAHKIVKAIKKEITK